MSLSLQTESSRTNNDLVDYTYSDSEDEDEQQQSTNNTDFNNNLNSLIQQNTANVLKQMNNSNHSSTHTQNDQNEHLQHKSINDNQSRTFTHLVYNVYIQTLMIIYKQRVIRTLKMTAINSKYQIHHQTINRNK